MTSPRGALVFRTLFDRVSCTYTYLLADTRTGAAVLIDPVDTLVDRDVQLLSDLRLSLTHAVNTHAHADHVTGTGLLKRRLPGCRSVISRASGAEADVLVSAGDKVPVGPDMALRVIATPGHTEGCVSYLLEGAGEPAMVFTGDTLLVRGCGRTDFQGGSSEALYDSVHSKLFVLPEETLVYPAHDYHGQMVSSIGEEIMLNPRLGMGKSKEEFMQIMADLKLDHPKLMDVAVPANLKCGITPDM